MKNARIELIPTNNSPQQRYKAQYHSFIFSQISFNYPSRFKFSSFSYNSFLFTKKFYTNPNENKSLIPIYIKHLSQKKNYSNIEERLESKIRINPRLTRNSRVSPPINRMSVFKQHRNGLTFARSYGVSREKARNAKIRDEYSTTGFRAAFYAFIPGSRAALAISGLYQSFHSTRRPTIKLLSPCDYYQRVDKRDDTRSKNKIKPRF